MVKGHQMFVQKLLGLQPGQNALLSNGRLIGPFAREEQFVAQDFSTLEMFELGDHGNSLLPRVSDLELTNINPDYDTSSFRSDLMMKVASLLRSLPQQRRVKIPDVSREHRCATVWGVGVCTHV